MSALPVACRGAAAGGASWWQAGVWAVTAYGLEEIEGHNAISAGCLADRDANGQLRWLGVMDEAGVDLDAFLAAFPVALALHGHGDVDPALIPASAKLHRKNLRRIAYEAAQAKLAEAAARKQEMRLHKRSRKPEAPMQTAH
jgi:hypothetical protein